MRYLDPKNDLTFKKVFGQHPHLLRSLLNALLPLGEDQEVVSLEYLPSEMVPALPLLKNSIVDVRCMDNFGRQFIVEMQMLWTDSFKYRVLFNASKAYVKQLDRGKKYEGLQPVYALSFVNAIFEPETDIYYHHYSMIHNLLTKKKIEGLELIFVELPKFKAKSLTEKKLEVLWLRYLTEIEDQTENLPDDLLSIPEIREAIECLQESAFTKGELETYDKYWDSISTERTLVADAEKIGLEKGMEKGMEKGELIGVEKGVQLTMQIIKLYNQGKTVPQIAQTVGRSEEYVRQIVVDTGLIS